MQWHSNQIGYFLLFQCGRLSKIPYTINLKISTYVLAPAYKPGILFKECNLKFKARYNSLEVKNMKDYSLDFRAILTDVFRVVSSAWKYNWGSITQRIYKTKTVTNTITVQF